MTAAFKTSPKASLCAPAHPEQAPRWCLGAVKGSHFLIKMSPTMAITRPAKSRNRFIITTVWK